MTRVQSGESRNDFSARFVNASRQSPQTLSEFPLSPTLVCDNGKLLVADLLGIECACKQMRKIWPNVEPFDHSLTFLEQIVA